MVAKRLPNDVEKHLDRTPAHTDATKQFQKKFIIEHLEELEDFYLALTRLEKPMKQWSLEDLEKEVDLAN